MRPPSASSTRPLLARLRRLAPALAALLAVVVVVQTTDLIVCADEAAAAEHAEGLPETGDRTDPADGHHHEGGAFADCLCHVVFAPTAGAPSAEAVRVPQTARFGAFVAAIPEVEPSGLDHVPLG